MKKEVSENKCDVNLKMDSNTLACDDTFTKVQNKVENVSKESLRKEIEFCVDIQKKLRVRLSSIWRENFETNRKMLEHFKEELNIMFKKMTLGVSLSGQKLSKYEDLINKFNSECYEIKNKNISKNDKTSIFKRTIKTNYETLINDLINIRNSKSWS